MTEWIAYTIAVSLLLGAAAWAAEAALRSLGRPARGVWLVALAGSLVLPAYAAAGGPLPSLLPFPTLATDRVSIAASVAPAGAGPGAMPPAPSHDRVAWFPLAWGLATAGLLVLVLALELRLRRERRGWIESVVAGVRVLVSRDVGPAVAGLLRGRIVLPAWALRLDPPVVRAIIAHEAEHLRAGDTRTLLTGLLAVFALPWNPVLWWQYRRLALAVELDCDARVLNALRDPRTYGLALLETARHRSRGALLHAALLRPRSFLRRRLEMIDVSTGRRVGARAAAAAAAAGLALAVAVCADSPAAPEKPDAMQGEVRRAVARARGLSGDPVEMLERVETANAINRLMTIINRQSAGGVEPVTSVDELRRRLERMLIPYTMGSEATSVRVLSVPLTPSFVLQAGQLEYVQKPRPHWILRSAVLRRVDLKDRKRTLGADTVRLDP